MTDQFVQKPARLQSLDILRGLTVAIMILVNNNGDTAYAYRTLMHSAWNGCTLADTVFPAFLFIMGISMTLSFHARRSKGATNGQILSHIAKRAILIFLLGVFINGFPLFHLHTLRIYGVLQRIALCFLMAGPILLFVRMRTTAALFFLLLAGYWILLTFVPVPGFGVPGRDILLLDPYANIVAYTDRMLFPARHLYHQGFYDPEGLLSTISSLATTLLGMLTGYCLRSGLPEARKVTAMLGTAAACISGGLIWNHWLPINKRLWTSSYILLTGGIALLVFALLYWWIDLRKKSPAWISPALVFGSNALGAYIFSELLASLLGTIQITSAGHLLSLQKFIYSVLFLPIPNGSIGSLAYSLSFVAICFLPVWFLYSKRIFLRI